VRLIPETTDIEGADAMAAAAGNTDCRNCLCSSGVPGPFAHIESLGTTTEQERQKRQFAARRIAAGAAMQGRTDVVLYQWFLGKEFPRCGN